MNIHDIFIQIKTNDALDLHSRMIQLHIISSILIYCVILNVIIF